MPLYPAEEEPQDPADEKPQDHVKEGEYMAQSIQALMHVCDNNTLHMLELALTTAANIAIHSTHHKLSDEVKQAVCNEAVERMYEALRNTIEMQLRNRN